MSCNNGLDRIRDKNLYQPARPHSLIRAFIVRLQTHLNKDSLHEMSNSVFKKMTEVVYLFVVSSKNYIYKKKKKTTKVCSRRGGLQGSSSLYV